MARCHKVLKQKLDCLLTELKNVSYNASLVILNDIKRLWIFSQQKFNFFSLNE